MASKKKAAAKPTVDAPEQPPTYCVACKRAAKTTYDSMTWDCTAVERGLDPLTGRMRYASCRAVNKRADCEYYSRSAKRLH